MFSDPGFFAYLFKEAQSSSIILLVEFVYDTENFSNFVVGNYKEAISEKGCVRNKRIDI